MIKKLLNICIKVLIETEDIIVSTDIKIIIKTVNDELNVGTIFDGVVAGKKQMIITIAGLLIVTDGIEQVRGFCCKSRSYSNYKKD
jgi:hypothetical protein